MNAIMYTDGGCRPNPGRGGWACVLLAVDSKGIAHTKELSGALESATNNTAELRAVFEGFKALKVGVHVEVVTDSQLVIGWLSQGWKRKDPHCTELLGHIEGIVREKALKVAWTYVKGHSGDKWNERCDWLCQTAIQQGDALK